MKIVNEKLIGQLAYGKWLEQIELELMTYACKKYGTIERASEALGCTKTTLYTRGFKSINRPGRPRKVKEC